MRKQISKGFTLIELVIVLVILGILAAAIAPKYVDLAGDSRTAVGKATKGAIQSAIAISIAENKSTPSLGTIATDLGSDVSATSTTLVYTHDGYTYTFTTYQDAGCSSATSATTDPLLCVTGPTIAEE